MQEKRAWKVIEMPHYGHLSGLPRDNIVINVPSPVLQLPETAPLWFQLKYPMAGKGERVCIEKQGLFSGSKMSEKNYHGVEKGKGPCLPNPPAN